MKPNDDWTAAAWRRRGFVIHPVVCVVSPGGERLGRLTSSGASCRSSGSGWCHFLLTVAFWDLGTNKTIPIVFPAAIRVWLLASDGYQGHFAPSCSWQVSFDTFYTHSSQHMTVSQIIGLWTFISPWDSRGSMNEWKCKVNEQNRKFAKKPNFAVGQSQRLKTAFHLINKTNIINTRTRLVVWADVSPPSSCFRDWPNVWIRPSQVHVLFSLSAALTPAYLSGRGRKSGVAWGRVGGHVFPIWKKTMEWKTLSGGYRPPVRVLSKWKAPAKIINRLIVCPLAAKKSQTWCPRLLPVITCTFFFFKSICLFWCISNQLLQTYKTNVACSYTSILLWVS